MNNQTPDLGCAPPDPEEEKSTPEPEPHLLGLMAMRVGPMAGDELTPQEAENLKNQKITDEIIEKYARLWISEGHYSDIEEARREAREVMWPFG
jgi:hypothetical protein